MQEQQYELESLVSQTAKERQRTLSISSNRTRRLVSQMSASGVNVANDDDDEESGEHSVLRLVVYTTSHAESLQ